MFLSFFTSTGHRVQSTGTARLVRLSVAMVWSGKVLHVPVNLSLFIIGLETTGYNVMRVYGQQDMNLSLVPVNLRLFMGG